MSEVTYKKLLYNDWVRLNASHIRSDGCTLVSELFRWCCLEHDLAYHYGRDPRLAYNHYRTTPYPECEDAWKVAPPISRSEADSRFRDCIRSKSKLGKWSPIAFFRWVGVRVGGGFHWEH